MIPVAIRLAGLDDQVISRLKQKLLASIVAISAIQVLKAFMTSTSSSTPKKLHGWSACIWRSCLGVYAGAV